MAPVQHPTATNVRALPEAAEQAEESHLRAKQQLQQQAEKIQQQAEEIQQLRAQRRGEHCSLLLSTVERP